MPSWIKTFFQKLGFSKFQFQILVVGLDAAGKTTIINWLNPKKTAVPQETTPTVGFQIEQFAKNNISFTVVDMSGAGRYRNLWEHYYASSAAVIFVVDSTDKLRMCVAKDELNALLTHKNIKRGTPILVYANKMDVKGALSGPEVAQLLELDRISDKPWHITSSCAITGEGLEDGLKWLSDRLTTNAPS